MSAEANIATWEEIDYTGDFGPGPSHRWIMGVTRVTFTPVTP